MTWVSTAGTWPPRTSSTATSGRSSGTPGSGLSGTSPAEQCCRVCINIDVMQIRGPGAAAGEPGPGPAELGGGGVDRSGPEIRTHPHHQVMSCHVLGDMSFLTQVHEYQRQGEVLSIYSYSLSEHSPSQYTFTQFICIIIVHSSHFRVSFRVQFAFYPQLVIVTTKPWRRII